MSGMGIDAVNPLAVALEQPSSRAPRRRWSAEERRRQKELIKTSEGAATVKSQCSLREIRESMGYSQRGFWQLFGVTQWAGCRYENEARGVPTSVLMLVVGFAEGKLTRGVLTDLRGLANANRAALEVAGKD